MTREQATKKLKALKELAEKGVGGEKEGARRLYEKLKNKYGISEEELRQEPKDPQEKQFDGDTLFQAATAEIMLKAEQEECDACPGHYGQKECESCGTGPLRLIPASSTGVALSAYIRSLKQSGSAPLHTPYFFQYRPCTGCICSIIYFAFPFPPVRNQIAIVAPVLPVCAYLLL